MVCVRMRIRKLDFEYCIAVVTNDSRNDNIANNDSGGKYIFKGNKSFKGYFIVIK